MSTATGILTIKEAADAAGIEPVELYRAQVRGFVKIRYVAGGDDRVLASDLQSWFASSQIDTAIPQNNGNWFCGENDLNHLENAVARIIESHVPDDAVSVVDIQKDYNQNRSLAISRKLRFNDPYSKLQAKPSSIVTLGGKAYDDRYGTLIMCAMVKRLRREAWGVCNLMTNMPVAETERAPLVRLYMPSNYEKIIAKVDEIKRRIFCSVRRTVKVTDKLTDNVVSIPVSLELTLASSIFPSTGNIMKAAF